MNSPERGRRLCLLFQAGSARFVVEATRVVEVAAPDGQSDRFRGVHAVYDASQLLGGEPETGPGVVVLLDVSPTLVLRVRRVLGVADLSNATLFQMPPRLGDGIGGALRGALLFERELYLELEVEKLSPRKPITLAAPDLPPLPLAQPPEQALVFQSEQHLWGIPVPFVSQVVRTGEAFCSFGTGKGPVSGLYPHGQALYPIYTPGALIERRAAIREDYLVLSELAGLSVGLSASRVLGVHGPFIPAAQGTQGGAAPHGLQGQTSQFQAKGLAGNVHFLDFQRMFC